MKTKLLIHIFWAIFIFSANVTKAQLFNTAYGNSALKNNTGNANTAVGYFATRLPAFFNSGNDNSSFGFNALNSNTTGSENSGFGANALFNNNIGSNNTAVGKNSLLSNTTGSNNTAFGRNSLNNNTDGWYNTGIGQGTLFKNTASYNTALGYQSQYHSQSGTYNTSAGYKSLFNNTGSSNTAFGAEALYDNHGSSNTGLGYAALNRNIEGDYNTATGEQALQSNTDGSYNTANGWHALMGNSSGESNTALGHSALINNGTGDENTAIGPGTLYSNYTGNKNTAVGYDALSDNNGSNNTAIGHSADVGNSNFTNATAIGYSATVNASNKIRLGNNAVAEIEGTVPYTPSDGRFKKNITGEVKGLSFILAVKPVVFNMQARKLDEFQMKNISADKRERILKSLDYTDAEKIRRSGFIAQEVAEAARKSGYNFDGVKVPKDDNDHYSIAYSTFVVPLVKAVQELAMQNDELQKQIGELKNKMAGIQFRVSPQLSNNPPEGGSLEQNISNPFAGTTTINYTLPQKFANAQISITDISGKMLKQVNVHGAGKGAITVDAATFPAGVYNYFLVIDGQVVSSKQMVKTK